MTQYIKLSTLEYPLHEGDIRLEHPEILESQTGPTFPCPDTYAPVEWVERPANIGENQTADIQPPQLIDGKWVAQWRVRDLTAEEIAEFERIHAEQQPIKVPQDTTGSGSEPDVIG